MWEHRPVPSLRWPVSAAVISFLALAVKTDAKAEIKISGLVKFCLILLLFVKYFVQECLQKPACAHSSSQSLQTSIS